MSRRQHPSIARRHAASPAIRSAGEANPKANPKANPEANLETTPDANPTV
jgi:hypothetical protein